MSPSRLWTREEMILVLGLYLRLPFGKFHHGNQEVIRMAHLIGRTPSSVAMRLSNYAALDPMLQARGVIGLTGGADKCRSYWEEFSSNKEALLFECAKIQAQYEHISFESKYSDILQDIPDSIVGLTREQVVKVRVNQSFFRQIVLANYNNKCALSGIDLPELLVASHIIPWSKNTEERMNPRNGICLSVLYDKAFDKGLISFSSHYHIMLSSRLKENVGKEYFSQYFEPISDCSLTTVGLRYPVNPDFLEWHRDCIFEHA